MKPAPVKRRYDGTRRRAQAQLTRGQIVASARRLFADRGYGATSIEQIAANAGVAVQTVYATYKSKRAVLFALLDVMSDQSGVASLRRSLTAERDPRRQLALLVEFSVGFYTTHDDVIQAAQSARGVERDLDDLWKAGEERRRLGQRPVVDAWARRGALKRGLSSSDAADMLWTLTSAECQRLLVVERGWTLRRYERWLVATLDALLLR